MSRVDGRSPTQLRPLHISINELDRADGSGRFAFGSNAVLASASGPLETRLSRELPTTSTLEITHRPLSGIAALPSRALVSTLERIFPGVLELEKFPRSLVQIVVQSITPEPKREVYGGLEVEASEQRRWPAEPIPADEYLPESTLEQQKISPASGLTFVSRAASINASTLALLSAGSIPMKGLPVAVALALTTRGILIVDPLEEEERKAVARFGFGWVWGTGISFEKGGATGMDVDGQDEGEGEMAWAEGEGNFSRQEWTEALRISKVVSKEILESIRSQLRSYLASHRLS